jgi:hypothetical protein
MIDDVTIQRILDSHKPPLDPEVREYILTFLTDDVEDEDILRSTLQEFLRDDECQSILSMLLPTLQTKPAETSTNKNSIEPTKMLSSERKQPEQDESSDPVATSEKPSSKKANRIERRQQKRRQRKSNKVVPKEEDKQELINDHASAWNDCQEDGKLWGGRGQGGRGIRYTGDNLQSIHLPSVSLHFEGNELLVDSPMDILQGHRYGLLGRNGGYNVQIVEMFCKDC